MCAVCFPAACPGGYRFTVQPPSELDCNPMDRNIPLKCVSDSASDTVTWYWTQNANDAGINGTAILINNNSHRTVVNFGSTNKKQLSFTVTSTTQGYYWCEISNASHYYQPVMCSQLPYIPSGKPYLLYVWYPHGAFPQIVITIFINLINTKYPLERY